jgi:hypothetical protein
MCSFVWFDLMCGFIEVSSLVDLTGDDDDDDDDDDDVKRSDVHAIPIDDDDDEDDDDDDDDDNHTNDDNDDIVVVRSSNGNNKRKLDEVSSKIQPTVKQSRAVVDVPRRVVPAVSSNVAHPQSPLERVSH